jgi:hypothetical protein
MIETISSSAPSIGLILGYGILTHGIIFLNDGLYWDGWMMDVWQQNKDWNSMRRFFSEVGLPNLSFEHRMLGRFSWRQMAYRAISVGSILTIAVVVFLTAVYTNAFSPPQAAVISLLLLSYPAYAVTFDGVVSLQYTFKVALFYIGCLFAVTTIDTFDAAHIFVFAGSLILFLVAFNANSLLVYFGGFLLFYAWLVHAQSPDGFGAYEYLKIFLLTILPIAYWVMKETRAPRHGYYKNYNKLRIGRISTLRHIGSQAFRYGIDVPMIKPIREVVGSKNVSFIFASLLLGSLAFHFGKALVALPMLHALQILLIGYALLFLGALPFILVGQHFSEGGWSSKNFMLFHLPFAFVVFGWLQLVPDSFQTVLIPIILVANTIYIVKTHLLYIAVSVKDKALMRWLATNSHIGSASVIKIRDTHWIEYPFERKEDIFRPAYLSCMVKHIWPGSRILAVLDNWGSSSGRSLTPEEIEQVLEETTIRYSFAPQVQRGSQYQVIIAAPAERFDAPKCCKAFDEAGDVNPSKQTAMVRMALEYLYLKWFSSRRLDKLFEKHFSISASEL